MKRQSEENKMQTLIPGARSSSSSTRPQRKKEKNQSDPSISWLEFYIVIPDPRRFSFEV